MLILLFNSDVWCWWATRVNEWLSYCCQVVLTFFKACPLFLDLSRQTMKICPPRTMSSLLLGCPWSPEILCFQETHHDFWSWLFSNDWFWTMNFSVCSSLCILVSITAYKMTHIHHLLVSGTERGSQWRSEQAPEKGDCRQQCGDQAHVPWKQRREHLLDRAL